MTCTGTRVCACPTCARVRHAEEVADLKGLVRELAAALNVWADAHEDVESLIVRAREACK